MKRLSAVVGEYTDKQTNQQKAEWASVGVIGVSAKGKEYMLLGLLNDPHESLIKLVYDAVILAVVEINLAVSVYSRVVVSFPDLELNCT